MGRRWSTRKSNYILKSNLPIGVQNMTLKSIYNSIVKYTKNTKRKRKSLIEKMKIFSFSGKGITFLFVFLVLSVFLYFPFHAVKSSVTYGAEIWKFNKYLQSKLIAMEIDFLKWSASCSILGKKLEIMIKGKKK